MIPLATTTIAVLRRPASTTRDPYDAQAAAPAVVSGVRAHIYMSGAGSDELVRGGQQEVRQLRLSCDPIELTHEDQIKDERTGEVYDVSWVTRRQGLNLDHVEAELKQVKGLA